MTVTFSRLMPAVARLLNPTQPLVVKHAPQGGGRLVESSSGDLLLIRKFDRFDFRFGRLTHSFKVFRLECAHGNRPEQVEKIESTGNDALFFDYPASMSARDFPGCQPKCIYFVADDWEVLLLMKNHKGPFTWVSSTWKTEERKDTSTASIVQRRTFQH